MPELGAAALHKVSRVGKTKMSALLAAVPLLLVYRTNGASSPPEHFRRTTSLGEEGQQLLLPLLD